MAFSWRRIARHLKNQNRPRDDREDQPTLGHHQHAPVHALQSPYRVCPHTWNDLWGAAALGYLRIARRLLDRGARVNDRDHLGRTALFYAVEDRRRDMAELLLAQGADASITDDTGISPIHLAIRCGDLGLLETLLESPSVSADLGARDTRTPLMEAVRRGDLPMVDLLIRKGADVLARDRYGHTAIFYVNGGSASRILPLLLEAGGSIEVRADDGDTPVHRALRHGDERLYRALVPPDDEQGQIERRGRLEERLLHAAVEGGKSTLVGRLIALGAEINVQNTLGQSPLLIALTREDLPCSARLMQAGATVGFLEAIALGDHERAVDALPLSRNVHLDAPVLGHETPLMGAVARGRRDLVELLLRCGASPNAATPTIGTPLDVAILTDQPELARLLLQSGANPHQLRHASITELRTLLGEEPPSEPTLPPATLDAERTTAQAVYEAAVTGDDAVRFLLLCGGSLDVHDSLGNTGLLLAIRDGDLAATERLLRFGARRDGAIAVARETRRTAILALLEQDRA